MPSCACKIGGTSGRVPGGFLWPSRVGRGGGSLAQAHTHAHALSILGGSVLPCSSSHACSYAAATPAAASAQHGQQLSPEPAPDPGPYQQHDHDICHDDGCHDLLRPDVAGDVEGGLAEGALGHIAHALCAGGARYRASKRACVRVLGSGGEGGGDVHPVWHRGNAHMQDLKA